MLTQLDPLPDQPVTLQPIFRMDAFTRLVPYPIIVEMWEKRLSGRIRRLWLKEFSEPERKKLSKLHKHFHNWYLVKGPPDQVALDNSTLELCQRACNFFAIV